MKSPTSKVHFIFTTIRISTYIFWRTIIRFAGTLTGQREEGKGTHGAENSCWNELGSTFPTRKYKRWYVSYCRLFGWTYNFPILLFINSSKMSFENLSYFQLQDHCFTRSAWASGFVSGPNCPRVFDGVYHPGLPWRDALSDPQQLFECLRTTAPQR